MTRRSPVVIALGALLVVYLAVPVVAFVARLGTARVTGFSTPGLWSALRTSVESATIATALAALTGIPLAYFLARRHNRLSRLIGLAVVLPLALPPVMGGILLIYVIGPYTHLGRLFGQRLTGSVAGIVIAQVFVAAPFLVISARSALSAVDPSLDDLAAVLGHPPLARFLRVDLPAAAFGIRAGLLLTWLRAMGEYGANVIVAYHPYSLPVFTYVQFSGPGIPTTQAPTVLVLAAAALAVAVSQLRLPRRRMVLPPPSADRVTGGAATGPSIAPVGGPWPATPVAVDLDLRVGTFHLRVRHEARSPRLAVLGPSGSGKSMTLRSIAGLYGPAAGTVRYAGSPVTVATEQRRIGYVPQGQTLLPHLDVAAQVMFGIQAEPGAARYWLDALGLAGLEDRAPGELSGGQRQRVSLAASLAGHPRLLLLDEPFSALDAPVRSELRQAVRALQRGGLSTVVVTHDPTEAAELSDEVVVLSAGRVLQAGATADVYAHPVSAEVARLVGFDNVVAGRTVDGGIDIGGGGPDIDGALLDLDRDLAGTVTGIGPPGSRVEVAIRAEAIVPDPAGPLRATVVDRSPVGGLIRLAGGTTLRVRSGRPLGERYSVAAAAVLPGATEPVPQP